MVGNFVISVSCAEVSAGELSAVIEMKEMNEKTVEYKPISSVYKLNYVYSD